MLYHSKRHVFNYWETEFLVDGRRVHSCTSAGCGIVAVLPPLRFDDEGNRMPHGGYSNENVQDAA